MKRNISHSDKRPGRSHLRRTGRPKTAVSGPASRSPASQTSKPRARLATDGAETSAKAAGPKRRRKPANAASAMVELLEPRLVMHGPDLPLPDTHVTSGGAATHIALDGTPTHSGGKITYSATVTPVGNSNQGTLQAVIPTGDRSITFSVANFGDMTFQIFENDVPRAGGRILELADDGFYSNVVFHRVINNFVIQGGDPTGTGSGGSGVDFDDDYNPVLKHTTSGLLSMAKTDDDTNDSQFFITENAQRHLDFNHSIFGFLTEGESVREAISNTPVNGSTPRTPVVISSATVFEDEENGVLRLIASEGARGNFLVTITATEEGGETTTKSISVQVFPDTHNETPFLLPIDPITVTAGSKTVDISARDVEGDNIFFLAEFDRTKVNVTFNQPSKVPTNQISTVQATITPVNGNTDNVSITFIAHAQGDTPTPTNPKQGLNDRQSVPVTISSTGAPGKVVLLTDTGISNSDGITSANNVVGKGLDFRVEGVRQGAVVSLFAADTLIGQALAAGTTVVIRTNETVPLQNGQINISASQRIDGSTSGRSQPLAVTIDTLAPQFISSPLLASLAGARYKYNVSTNEDAGGPAFALTTFPSGMAISATGQITWIPALNQVGTHNVVVRVTDKAGNSSNQNFQVNITRGAPGKPGAITLLSDTGILSGDKLTNRNNSSAANTLTFRVANVVDGALVTLFAGGTAIGQGIANGNSIDIVTNGSSTLAEGNASITAIQSLLGLAGGTSDPLAITIDSQAPIFDPLDLLGIPFGQLLEFNVNTDAERLPSTGGQNGTPAIAPVLYTVENSPAGVTVLNPVTGVIRWTPAKADIGQQVIHVVATDAAGNRTVKDVPVTVINVAPVFQPPQTTTFTVAEKSAFTFTHVASDPNGPTDALTFRLAAGAPAGMTIDPATGVIRFTPTESQAPGSFLVTTIVADSLGQERQQQLTLNTTEVNEPPVFDPVQDLTLAPGEDLALQLHATDPDVPLQNLVFELLNAPDGAEIDPVTGLFRFTPPASGAGATFNIVALVRESAGTQLSATLNFQITVSNAGLGLFVANRPLLTNAALAGRAADDYFGSLPGLSFLGVPFAPLSSSTSTAFGTPPAGLPGYRGGAANFSLFTDTGVGRIGPVTPPQNKDGQNTKPIQPNNNGNQPPNNTNNQNPPSTNPIGESDLSASLTSLIDALTPGDLTAWLNRQQTQPTFADQIVQAFFGETSVDTLQPEVVSDRAMPAQYEDAIPADAEEAATLAAEEIAGGRWQSSSVADSLQAADLAELIEELRRNATGAALPAETTNDSDSQHAFTSNDNRVEELPEPAEGWQPANE